MIDVYSVRKHTELEKTHRTKLVVLEQGTVDHGVWNEGKERSLMSINMCSMHVDGEMIYLYAMSMFWISIRLFIGFWM